MTKQETRGRKPDANSKSGQIRELLKTGMSPADIARQLGCRPNLVYNVKAKVAGSSGSKRSGPARRAKTTPAAAPSFDGLAQIIASVKNSENQRQQLRGALERIQTIIRDALA